MPNTSANLEATIAQGVNATDANGQPITSSTPPSLLLVTRNHDTGRTRDNDDSSLINQTELMWNTVTGSVKHTVLAGLELSQREARPPQLQARRQPVRPGCRRLRRSLRI